MLITDYKNYKKMYNYFLQEKQILMERIFTQRIAGFRWITCPTCLCQHRFIQLTTSLRFGICPDCKKMILEIYRVKISNDIHHYCFRTKIWIYLKEEIIEKSYEPHRILQTGLITAWPNF
jgi:hypothetical protein